MRRRRISGRFILAAAARRVREELRAAMRRLAQMPGHYHRADLARPVSPWLTHPFSWSDPRYGPERPEVSLLDLVDEHVLATLQALPDAPASLFALPSDRAAVPDTGGNWKRRATEGTSD